MANELTWHDVLAEEKQHPIFLIPSTVASEAVRRQLSIHQKMS